MSSTVYIDLDGTTFFHQVAYKEWVKARERPQLTLIETSKTDLSDKTSNNLNEFLPLVFIEPQALANMINKVYQADRSNDVRFMTSGTWGDEIYQFIITVLCQNGLHKNSEERLKKNKIHNVITDKKYFPSMESQEFQNMPKGYRIRRIYQHHKNELVILFDDDRGHKRSIEKHSWRFILSPTDKSYIKTYNVESNPKMRNVKSNPFNKIIRLVEEKANEKKKRLSQKHNQEKKTPSQTTSSSSTFFQRQDSQQKTPDDTKTPRRSFCLLL